MDFKNFNLAEFQKNNYRNDIEIDIKYYDEKNKKLSPAELKTFRSKNLTISDAFFVTIQKGSENFYIDIECYLYDYELHKIYKPVVIQVFTKDNHDEIKKIAIELIKQS